MICVHGSDPLTDTSSFSEIEESVETPSSGSRAAATLRLVVISAIGVLGVLTALVVVLTVIITSAYVLNAESVFGVPISLGDTPWAVAAAGLAVVIGVFVMLGFALYRLQRILATLASGDPFITANAQDARLLWMVFGGFELARYIIATATETARVLSTTDDPPPFSLALIGSLIEQFHPMVWLSVLVIFVLAEVFREGARMRAEQKLTI